MFRLSVLTTCLALTLTIPVEAQEDRLVRLSTGSLAGAYFPVGVAICRTINKTRREHGLRCAAIASDGSLDNINRLRDGAAEMALVQSDTQRAAVNGQVDAPFTELRALLSLHAEPLTVVTRADSGVTGIQDLSGKRVSIGGSSQLPLWRGASEAAGLQPDSYEEVSGIAPEQQARALCDGEVDAFAMVIGHPARTVQEATLGCESRILNISGPAVTDLAAENAAWFPADIPGKLYQGNPEPIDTIGVGATLVTTSAVPDAVVEIVLSSIFDNLDQLRGFEPVLADLSQTSMTGIGLSAPLHAAAEAFYGDRGWTE
ncbi:TAXI family TRAP transporter solute-binding subunit [Amaricoccus tamworthensis]|uniref:TAXI family TRAP transporter solute-binding subunit n=1 Tax=Amaricoccus tamworthensis TaxID=57002 RepID=UPI003C7BD1F1